MYTSVPFFEIPSHGLSELILPETRVGADQVAPWLVDLENTILYSFIQTA